MSRIRIRFELNKGRDGIPPKKLIALTERLDEFVRSLANDLNIPKEKNEWLAKEFMDGSCYYTLELQAVESAARLAAFNNNTKALTSYRPEQDHIPVGVSQITAEKYASISDVLEIGEVVPIGLFNDDASEPQWIDGSKSQMESVGESVESHLEYMGSIMGNVHELNKGAEPPYIKVRDLVSGDLIRCEYDNKDYDEVVALVKSRDSIVNVYGLTLVSRLTGKIELIKASRFEIAPTFSDTDYGKFFGCAPEILERQTSDDLVRKQRKHGRFKT